MSDLRKNPSKMSIQDAAFVALSNHTFAQFIESLERNGLASKLNSNLK